MTVSMFCCCRATMMMTIRKGEATSPILPRCINCEHYRSYPAVLVNFLALSLNDARELGQISLCISMCHS